MIQRRHALFIAFVMSTSATAYAQSTAQPLEKFLELKSKWKDLVGTSYRLEGRYSLLGKNLLKFKNCSLSFRSTKDFPALSGRSRTIEVFGRLAKSNGQIYFAVSRLKELPSDSATLKIMQAKLKDPAPQDWYQLAEWARKRATFYKDDQLTKQADATYLIGIQIERNAIKKDSFANLFALSEKVKSFALPDRLRMQYVHEAFCVDWLTARQTANAKALADLKTRVLQHLPNSTQPFKGPNKADAKKYVDGPILYYHDANDMVRLELHRILYVEIVKQLILSKVSANGSNGTMIAGQLDEQIPELHELAETYRDKELDYRLSRVATATRDEMFQLVANFRKRKRPGKANETVLTWLESFETSKRKEGTGGLIEISNEYLNLASKNYLEEEYSRDHSRRVLQDADRMDPNSVDVAKGMKRLGYIKYNGRWTKESEVPAGAIDKAAIAMAKGGNIVGMTLEQARASGLLPGAPDRIIRIVSADKIFIIWVYINPDKSRDSIQFVRDKSRGETKVVGISQINPK